MKIDKTVLSERRLGSDARAGVRVRAVDRRRQLRFVRDSWLFLAVLFGVGAALVTGATLAVQGSFDRGLVLGAGATAVVVYLGATVVFFSGTAAPAMGAVAEQWTASELRKLRSQGWVVVNHLSLKAGDIDHVLVGPGGLIVGETKWSGDGWQLSPPSEGVARAIAQVKANARTVHLWEGRRHELDQARQVVFLWSASDADVDRSEPLYIDGVAVVLGTRAAKIWRDKVAQLPVVLDREHIEQLRNAIHKQVQVRDRREAAEFAGTPTYTRVYWTVVATMLATISGLLTALEAVRLGSAVIWLPLQGVSIAAGVVARRWRRSLRFEALGWITGSIFGLSVTVLVLTHVVR